MTRKTASIQTPTEHLRTHGLTRMLEVLGVKNEQLEGMRFTSTNQGRPFDQWSITFLESTPEKAIPLVKAYCALKWLILEDPSGSRDKDDAWRLVSEALAAPTFKIGETARCAQTNRAKKLRGKITTGGKTLGQMIRELAVKPQHRLVTAKELWPHLWALLGGEDLDPEQVQGQSNPKDPKQWFCTYDFNDARKRITFLRFRDIVSEARSKKKSR